MPKRLRPFELDLPAVEPPCARLVAGPMARAPSIGTPARPADRLLGATIDENKDLHARVRELEAELGRRSVELARLRWALRGAVREALTDPLTGLANRRSFDLELQALSEQVPGSALAHLLMIDVDHFKRVNDAHGHDFGDEVLLVNVRRDSVVARLGGDEFGILLLGAGPTDAAGVASRLCQHLASRRLVVRGSPGCIERITLSIGMAGCRSSETCAQWYARADAALYEAKRGGRNRISLARPLELDNRVLRSM